MYLAKIIRQNSNMNNLMVLDLRENKIGDVGVKLLAEACACACESKSSLKKLYLTKNPFHDDGTNALLELVKHKADMIHVELSQVSHAATMVRYYSSLNYGGRRCLVENYNSNYDEVQQVPPATALLDVGVWPLVIERVNNIDWFEEHLDSHRQDVIILYLLRAPPLFEVLLNRNRNLPRAKR